MNDKDIKDVLNTGIFPYDPDKKAELIETPISYVILKGKYAYKIKKNIKLSFLNFSSLTNRKHYCQEELRLNKRLSGDMYIRILPLSKKNSQWFIGNSKGSIKEYAVLMKRMNPARQLNYVLEHGRVSKKFIIKLANVISNFHLHEKSLKIPYNPFFLSNEFEDIQSVNAEIKKRLGITYHALVKNAIKLSNIFILLQQEFVAKRAKMGYFRDCHGDLHAKNIFIYKEPLIFDCIEFKKEFRQIDVLNEIAFLCMDLETAGYKDLSKTFLNAYIKQTGFEFTEKEKHLFTYFKASRACIRAKVAAINMIQHPENKSIEAETKKYIIAMTQYAEKAVTAIL
jgi:aminoglycoside phosphotransferase family enzyme